MTTETPRLRYEEAKTLAIQGGRLLFARQLISGAISLGGSVFLIRELGPPEWAMYSIGYFVVVYLSDLFGATVLGALIHSAAPPDQRMRQAAARLMQLLGICSALLIAAVSVPIADLYGDESLAEPLLAVAACALVYALRSPAVAVLERRLDYRWLAAADLLDQLVFYAIAIPLVIAGHGLVGVAIALGARGVLSLIMLTWHTRVPLLGRWRGPEIRRLAGFAAPSLGSSGLNLVTGLIPAIVLGAAYAQELAFVVASATILGYTASVQFIVQRVGFPGLSQLRSAPEEHAGAFERTLTVMNVVMVSLVVPLGILSPLTLPFLFGAEWADAVPVFLAMAAGVLLNGPATLSAAALNSLGAPRSVAMLALFSTSVYLGLALVLTEQDPLLGVALAWAGSRLLSWIVVVLLLRARGVSLSLWSSATVLLGAIAAMCALAALVNGDAVILGLGLTLVLAVAWGVVKSAELTNLVGWLRHGGAEVPRLNRRPDGT